MEKEEKGDPLLEQFSLQELYHMLELLDRIEADRSVDLTTTESKMFKYLLDEANEDKKSAVQIPKHCLT